VKKYFIFVFVLAVCGAAGCRDVSPPETTADNASARTVQNSGTPPVENSGIPDVSAAAAAPENRAAAVIFQQKCAVTPPDAPAADNASVQIVQIPGIPAAENSGAPVVTAADTAPENSVSAETQQKHGAADVIARSIKNYNFKKLKSKKVLYGVAAFLIVVVLLRFALKIKISVVFRAALYGVVIFFFALTGLIFYFYLSGSPLYLRFLHRAGPSLFLFWSIFFLWGGNKILNFIRAKYFPAQKYIIYFTLAKAGLLGFYALCVFLLLFTRSIKTTSVSATVIIGGLAVMLQNTFLNMAAVYQLRSGGMLKLGDWIEIPKRGLDGTVIEFKMTSVKVQNWNGTLMFLNAYDLISDSFVNWSKIIEQKKRRVKRSLRLDLYSIRQLPRGFEGGLAEKDFFKNAVSKEEFSSALGPGDSFTNLHFFTAFCRIYLKKLAAVSKDDVYMLRQMPPDGGGLPLEFYFFIDADGWQQYETGQAEVFEYLISILPYFELRMYQKISGAAFHN